MACGAFSYFNWTVMFRIHSIHDFFRRLSDKAKIHEVVKSLVCDIHPDGLPAKNSPRFLNCMKIIFYSRIKKEVGCI